MSVLGLNLEYTVKHSPLPSGGLLSFALGNSFKQRAIFDLIGLLLSYYRYIINY